MTTLAIGLSESGMVRFVPSGRFHPSRRVWTSGESSASSSLLRNARFDPSQLQTLRSCIARSCVAGYVLQRRRGHCTSHGQWSTDCELSQTEVAITAMGRCPNAKHPKSEIKHARNTSKTFKNSNQERKRPDLLASENAC